MRDLQRSLGLTATVEENDVGVEFRQEADWVKLSQVKPEETVTVLLATEYAVAIGHLGLSGEINIEFMPWGQMESEEGGLEFTHWMYLPAAPCWLCALCGKIRTLRPEQLSLWHQAETAP